MMKFDIENIFVAIVCSIINNKKRTVTVCLIVLVCLLGINITKMCIGKIKPTDKPARSSIFTKMVLENKQSFNDSEVPERLAKMFAGKESILDEHLNKSLTSLDNLLIEVQQGLSDGKLRPNASNYGPANTGGN